MQVTQTQRSPLTGSADGKRSETIIPKLCSVSPFF